MFSELPIITGVIGVVSAVYVSVFLCLSRKNTDTNHIISSVYSIIHSEVNSLRTISNNDNPYDIFAKIYPRMKEMNNDQITELVDLIDTYNSNWVDS